MKKEDLQKLFNNVEKKIGKENYGKIADDIGKIISDNESLNTTISNKDTEINDLKKNNEMLITANGSLLQQVGMGEEPTIEQNDDEDKKPKYSFKNAFDEKGNFK